jgi:hypothetical protein
MLAGAYVTRQHKCTILAGDIRQPPAQMEAPASKDSHLCWHKIAGGCCARQHKGVLAASKNRFWPSVISNVSRWEGIPRRRKK